MDLRALHPTDPAAKAALPLLSFSQIAHRPAPFVVAVNQLECEALLKASRKWSSGERALVELAVSLWDQIHTVNLHLKLGALHGAFRARAGRGTARSEVCAGAAPARS
jgi:hypothetical protein